MNKIIEDLKLILQTHESKTQEELCSALALKGHPVNQSKVSRLLHKLNAIKFKTETGEMVYTLPHDVSPPRMMSVLKDLVLDVTCNEAMIVISTSPGSASLIARILDHKKCDLLGTIAGDDVIFAAPKSVQFIKETLAKIIRFLSE